VKLIVIAAIALVAWPATAQPQQAPQDILREVRVHGNHTTPDADVLALAGLTIGAPIDDAAVAAAEDKLRASGRFANIDVRKRFRSIADPTDILIVLVVDEHEGVSENNLLPGPFRRLTSAGMWLPIVYFADGYGFTYGARITLVDLVGKRSRISMPMTWGGERLGAVEFEKRFDGGLFTRLLADASLLRRENPHLEVGDFRRQVKVRAERDVTPWFRVGGGLRLTSVRFGDLDEFHTAPSVDIKFDTRTDPVFPRNAVHAVIGWEQLRFDDARRIQRINADIRGYLGLVRSSVFAVRVATSQVNGPLPLYEQALLGGTAMLRGYRFGYRAGDELAIASAELRVPLTSPLNVGRLGVKGFVDAGTIYGWGEDIAKQTWDRSVGAGLFFTFPFFRLDVDVAKPRSGKARVHFGLGVTF
jgi:outer membrane protein assembly factor BamA